MQAQTDQTYTSLSGRIVEFDDARSEVGSRFGHGGTHTGNDFNGALKQFMFDSRVLALGMLRADFSKDLTGDAHKTALVDIDQPQLKFYT